MTVEQITEIDESLWALKKRTLEVANLIWKSKIYSDFYRCHADDVSDIVRFDFELGDIGVEEDVLYIEIGHREWCDKEREFVIETSEIRYEFLSMSDEEILESVREQKIKTEQYCREFDDMINARLEEEEYEKYLKLKLKYENKKS